MHDWKNARIIEFLKNNPGSSAFEMRSLGFSASAIQDYLDILVADGFLRVEYVVRYFRYWATSKVMHIRHETRKPSEIVRDYINANPGPFEVTKIIHLLGTPRSTTVRTLTNMKLTPRRTNTRAILWGKS